MEVTSLVRKLCGTMAIFCLERWIMVIASHLIVIELSRGAVIRHENSHKHGKHA